MSIQDDLIKFQMMQQAAMQQQQQPNIPYPHGIPAPSQRPAYDESSMMMSPEQAYMMQQEQPQMQFPNGMPMRQPEVSPLESGASRGWEAAKRSLEMSSNENRRAMGRALMAFVGGMDRHQPGVGSGLSGALGSISHGFEPALAAYDAERDRIAKMNLALQQQEKIESLKERQEARAQSRDMHNMNMEEKRVGLLEDSFNLKQKKYDEEAKELEVLNQASGKIPLSFFKSPSMQKYAQNYVDKKIEEGDHAARMMDTLSRLNSIYDMNPDISKHMSTLVLAAQSNDPTVMRQKLINLGIPEEQRADYDLAAKYFANLKVDGVKALGGVRANTFIEKLISQATPGTLQSGTAVKRLLGEMHKEAEHSYENAQKVSDAYSEGYLEKIKPRTLEREKSSESMSGGKKPPAEMTTEEIMAELKGQV